MKDIDSLIAIAGIYAEETALWGESWKRYQGLEREIGAHCYPEINLKLLDTYLPLASERTANDAEAMLRNLEAIDFDDRPEVVATLICHPGLNADQIKLAYRTIFKLEIEPEEKIDMLANFFFRSTAIADHLTPWELANIICRERKQANALRLALLRANWIPDCILAAALIAEQQFIDDFGYIKAMEDGRTANYSFLRNGCFLLKKQGKHGKMIGYRSLNLTKRQIRLLDAYGEANRIPSGYASPPTLQTRYAEWLATPPEANPEEEPYRITDAIIDADNTESAIVDLWELIPEIEILPTPIQLALPGIEPLLALPPAREIPKPKRGRKKKVNN